MKNLLLSLLLIVVLCPFAMAADSESGTVAELYEHPGGRSVTFDESEIITVWYEGSLNGGIGLSANTAGQSTLRLYESGQPITATRFGGSATIDVDANVAEDVVSLINSDTSGSFKASLGRDATPGTSCLHVIYIPVTTLPISEKSAWDNSDKSVTPDTIIKEDASSSLQLRAGFVGKDSVVNRLKRIEETIKGTGNHLIKVWDGESVVYRRGYEASIYSGTGSANNSGYQPGVTPLTIAFNDGSAKGLAAKRGNNLTVTSEWSTTLVGTTEFNTNLSILVGEWKN